MCASMCVNLFSSSAKEKTSLNKSGIVLETKHIISLSIHFKHVAGIFRYLYRLPPIFTYSDFTCQDFKYYRQTFKVKKVTWKEYGKFQESFVIVKPYI